MPSFFPLLIIGTSNNGPDGVVVVPDSLKSAQDLFGLYRDEYHLITAGASSVTLSNYVWGSDLTVYRKTNGQLLDKSLYAPEISGNIVTFGTTGTSGEFIFRYAALPEDTNLLLALENVLSQGSPMPGVYRLPGTVSSVEIGDLLLASEYSGDIYNNISVQVSGGILTIANDNSAYYPTLSYATSSIVSLSNSINLDFSLGKQPFFASYTKSISVSIPNGTYISTGGTTGTFTASGITSVLSTIDIDSVGLLLLSGGQSSGVISETISYIEDNSNGPTCLVAGDTLSYKEVSTDSYINYINSFKNLFPYSNRLFYVPGFGRSVPTVGEAYWSTLSSTFAGLFNTYKSSPTYKASSIREITPFFSESQLSSLTNTCVFTRSIGSGITPFRSFPVNGENPLINKVKVELSSRLHDVFDDVIGNERIPIEEINNRLGSALDGLPNVTDISYSTRIDLDNIFIDLYVLVYGEIEYINLSISTSRAV